MSDILIFAISFVAAFVFSLGGVGAAIILVPVLTAIGIPFNMAKPIGLFNNMASMIGATISNIRNKRSDIRTGIPIIIFSFLFAIIGAYATKFIPVIYIMILFVVFLLFSSFMFLFFKNKGRNKYREDRPFFLLSMIGVAAGLLAGLLGIGGGSVISPLMLMSGYNPKKITVITAFAIPFSAFSAFVTYWAMGSINWHLLLVVSSAGVVGATLGTAYMQKNLNAATVKKILAVILFLMAIKLGWSIITN
jgi:uncharacterized membrane protein YfcA